MAAYTVAEDRVAVHDKTLVAATADTVTFTDAPGRVEIVSDGAAKMYVTGDGTTPTASGDNTYVLPAVPCARVIDIQDKAVKLISSGTPTYSVQRA